MQYYFAPLEGLTDYIYRQLHHRFFPGLDRYYTPFLSPTIHRCLTPKEARELPPVDELDYFAVPQILTKVAEDFLWLAHQCRDRGYTEVNLNLGCPSGTVTAKGKGAGMLKDISALDQFLNQIYSNAPLDISIKSRIGFSSPDEFPALLEVFNRYPIKELIIHPRVRTAFYNGTVDLQAVEYAVSNSKAPICYNGDITCVDHIHDISKRFPSISSVMLGRGLIGDPGMLDGTTDAATLASFHDALLDAYREAFGGARNAMSRMKEHWRHLGCKFENAEKLTKQLRKTNDIEEYKEIVYQILHECPIRENLLPNW